MGTQWPGSMGSHIIPPRPDPKSGLDHLPARPLITRRWSPGFQHAPPPASAGSTAYSAGIEHGPTSVSEVVYNATPVSNVTGLVSELRDRRPRRLVSKEWIDRLWSLPPPRFRDGITTVQRGLVRKLPLRQNTRLPSKLTRE